MTAVVDIRSTIPGAFERSKTREFPDGSKAEFEEAPAGWLTKDGEVRKKDHRAYYFTPAPKACEPCEGTGRVEGKTSRGKQCPDCKATGEAGRRSRFISVTTALDSVCPKPGLFPWSEARGIEGAVEAVRLGLIDPFDPESVAAAVETVRWKRLGADRARDDAAARGLNVHDCNEIYMTTGSPPNPAEHPREHWGYLRAYTRWIMDHDPEPVAVEEIVAHPDDEYAGRLDLRVRLPKIGCHLATVDAKTQENGGIYMAAHAQVNLYERAARRQGEEPADRLFVVVFAANGEYRMMPADHPDAFVMAALAWMRAAKPVDSMCERENRREREARREAVAA